MPYEPPSDRLRWVGPSTTDSSQRLKRPLSTQVDDQNLRQPTIRQTHSGPHHRQTATHQPPLVQRSNLTTNGTEPPHRPPSVGLSVVQRGLKYVYKPGITSSSPSCLGETRVTCSLPLTDGSACDPLWYIYKGDMRMTRVGRRHALNRTWYLVPMVIENMDQATAVSSRLRWAWYRRVQRSPPAKYLNVTWKGLVSPSRPSITRSTHIQVVHR